MDGWRRVFAHGGAFQYEDAATRSEYWWQPDSWREVPPSVAAVILPPNAHRLCDVTGEADPDGHTCPLSARPGAYPTTAMRAPPRTTVMRPRREV